MAKFREIYKCEICGNIVEVLHEGIGVLVCCDEEMKLVEEKVRIPLLKNMYLILKKLKKVF